LNQFLTPYDILRLKNGLGLRSSAFLERYTIRHDGPQTGLPVITLRPVDASGLTCPFVTPDGCSVYDNRPGSCRTYPLARAVTRSKETGQLTEHYALLREPHCRGHEYPRQWTVREWITDQGLGEYHRVNDLFLSIIALKNKHHPGPLPLASAHMFHVAMYDLDAFRTQIVESGILQSDPPEPLLMEQLLCDDLALLEFSHRWIIKNLFEEQA
jgi:Fe-S-cluster containining protein